MSVLEPGAPVIVSGGTNLRYGVVVRSFMSRSLEGKPVPIVVVDIDGQGEVACSPRELTPDPRPTPPIHTHTEG